jgi:magnesium-transporting ATPase (P-type)
MITGDNILTATNIARQVGIVGECSEKERIIEASQLINDLDEHGLLGYEHPSKL